MIERWNTGCFRASELETQLQRLDVTTVGQLSSLTEATIERLPFIPPKVTRLRKILQVIEKCQTNCSNW